MVVFLGSAAVLYLGSTLDVDLSATDESFPGDYCCAGEL